MFAAGLGLGLMFYGVAEPISHFAAPPHGLAEPRSQEAELVALETTYFHWGFNGWAIYAVMGLALAYFTFRRGKPNLVSSTFTPLLGERANETPARPHDRRARDLRDALRHRHVAGPRRAADQQRAQLPLGRHRVEHASAS